MVLKLIVIGVHLFIHAPDITRCFTARPVDCSRQHFALRRAKVAAGRVERDRPLAWFDKRGSSGRKGYFGVMFDIAVRPFTGLEIININRQRLQFIQTVQIILLAGIVFSQLADDRKIER